MDHRRLVHGYGPRKGIKYTKSANGIGRLLKSMAGNKARNRFYLYASLIFLSGWSWILFYAFYNTGEGINLCLFKSVTGFPCPSCGTTRGINAVLHGEWQQALFYNPLSYPLTAFLLFVPTWIIKDLALAQRSLMTTYRVFEHKVKKSPIVLFFGLGIIAINWIVLNIYK